VTYVDTIVTAIGSSLTMVLLFGKTVLSVEWWKTSLLFVTFNGKSIGSILISQEFKSPKFFHSRPSSDSASGLDPHITPENAFAQISNVSKASGIPKNTLRTLIELDIERNKNSNLLAFAPDYINVLELNTELVKRYPEAYGEFINTGNIILHGR
jgi:K+-transporting ATPase ATPase C chain